MIEFFLSFTLNVKECHSEDVFLPISHWVIMQIIICVEKVSTACDIFAAQISGTFQRYFPNVFCLKELNFMVYDLLQILD